MIGWEPCANLHQQHKTASEAYLVWKERVLNCGLGAGVARGPVAGTWAWVMSRSALWPPTPGAQSPATSHTQTSTGAHLGMLIHCVDILDISSFLAGYCIVIVARFFHLQPTQSMKIFLHLIVHVWIKKVDNRIISEWAGEKGEGYWMFLPFATFIAKADGRNISTIASARYRYRLQTVGK